MDYKYIEQLMERYWQGTATLEEEQILHAFFRQKDIPAGLEKFRDIFISIDRMKDEETLGDDFDARILAMTTGEQPVKARVITMRRRMMPLFKAAAVVAIVVTLGNAAQMSFRPAPATDTEEINYTGYEDTFSDPSVAYDRVHNALELVSEGISSAQRPDSAAAAMTIQNDSIGLK
ncbi:MAG: hypothetical protein Q4C43_07390 [Prevotella sp.]|nr:hypothetical protein [Prevotella sp.]MDO4933762.1 hypothetical protein [Prevotella sp.]